MNTLLISVSKQRIGLFNTEKGVSVFLSGMQAIKETKNIKTKILKTKNLKMKNIKKKNLKMNTVKFDSIAVGNGIDKDENVLRVKSVKRESMISDEDIGSIYKRRNLKKLPHIVVISNSD